MKRYRPLSGRGPATFFRADQIITGAPADSLINPPSLADRYQETTDGNDVEVLPIGTPFVPKIVETRQRLQELGAALVTIGFDGPGITPAYLQTTDEMVGFLMERGGFDPDRPMPAAPPNEKLVPPATDSLLNQENLLRTEYSHLLKGEDVDQVRLARQLYDDSDAVINNFSRIVRGATITRTLASNYMNGFCQRVNARGRTTIDGSWTLGEKLKALLTLIDFNANKAQETLVNNESVRHETEAATLAEVTKNIVQATQGPIATAPGTPLTGAHAPGQTAVPAGAMPLSVVPEPKHPKPGRKGNKPTSRKPTKPA